MDDQIKKSLFDIKTSIRAIHEYLGEDIDFEKFCRNKLVKRAVEREFEIIGEALNRIMKIDNSIKITDGRKIVNLRNYIIHVFFACILQRQGAFFCYKVRSVQRRNGSVRQSNRCVCRGIVASMKVKAASAVGMVPSTKVIVASAKVAAASDEEWFRPCK